jgi:hypothetical protein
LKLGHNYGWDLGEANEAFISSATCKVVAKKFSNKDKQYINVIFLEIRMNAKIHNGARHQWLRPIILATQGAEIRRIIVQSQPWTNDSGDPISTNTQPKTGLVEWLKW